MLHTLTFAVCFAAFLIWSIFFRKTVINQIRNAPSPATSSSIVANRPGRPKIPYNPKLERLQAVGGSSTGTPFCWPTEEDLKTLDMESCKMRLKQVNLKHGDDL